MDFLDRYRRKVGIGLPIAATNPFIEMALNKISIQKYVSGETSEENFDAVLIFKDKEGPDDGVLYTYKKDGLDVGDSIVKKGSREENDVFYLIVEEVKRVDGSEVIRVFNVLETNVLFTTQNSSEKRPAYLSSTLRRSTGVGSSARDGIVIEAKKAVMVAPKGYKLRLDSKLNIENLITNKESYASWLVEGIDDVSTPNINYISLKQVMKEDFDYSEPDLEDEEGNTHIDAYVTITLDTSDGYIKTNPTANVLERKSNKVLIQVPQGPGLFTVKVKNADGDIVEYKYTIRG